MFVTFHSIYGFSLRVLHIFFTLNFFLLRWLVVFFFIVIFRIRILIRGTDSCENKLLDKKLIYNLAQKYFMV